MKRSATAAIAACSFLAGCFHPPAPLLDEYGAVADFALTERSGRIVRRDDLLGRVWVASFIFTCCTQSCPQISGSMARLQHELVDQPDVRLVSFSVYPESDTPEVLRSYAEAYRADPERWWFLTGPKESLYDLIRGSFHLGVEPTTGAARRPGNEVLHSSKLVVVDRRGVIRGYFDGTNPDEVPRIGVCVRRLLREKT
ncbi:MAG: SCO family protein [Gemmataceae bacterium]|nr:SCO family protein [Gemmataceae bacterium]MDW8266520.1 SCO family protein [Gemmataceae bacterium]